MTFSIPLVSLASGVGGAGWLDSMLTEYGRGFEKFLKTANDCGAGVSGVHSNRAAQTNGGLLVPLNREATPASENLRTFER